MPDRPAVIRTPDQRLRVFVSSTLQELADERAAAREAITSLRLAPVMFELGARPHPPRDLYRAYLAQSHIFVGIYWKRYGWAAPGEDVSGLEDEYRLSGDKPKLIYIKASPEPAEGSPAPEREPRLKELLERIKGEDTASYKYFSSADELRELLENDLLLLLTERFETSTHQPLPTGTVTFLFSDIEGSTPLWEREPDPMRVALMRHDAILRQAIEAHGGQVYKVIGDAFQVAFAIPAQAIEAALTAQRGLAAEIWPTSTPIRVRMGLHAGPAEAEASDYATTHTLNRVARIMSAGHGGQVLLSLSVAELVRDRVPAGVTLRDLGQHRMKGLTQLEHLFQVVVSDLPADFPPLKLLEAFPNNLPIQLTSFIGREREMAEVKHLLTTTHLLTLTGSGGAGKTRLALQVAADLLDDFKDGVFFVPLASISNPVLVPQTIAQTFDLHDSQGKPLQEQLKDYIRGKRMLLVLDNFEQVIDAAPFVGDLLSAAPRLKILVTSREVLRLSGEMDYPVPPLALPDPKRLPTLAQLMQYEAVALFIERAQAVKPDFAMTNENAPAVAEICYQLDGLPLAIELAAARVRLLPPQAILPRLSSRLKLLTGGARDLPTRQQTLRSAIDWSYSLLSADEQTLFARLGVFVGGCTLEAVEAECNLEGDLDVLEGVASLVNKSLVRQEERNGQPRFGLLETIREYALERLEASGEAETIRRQHANFFLTLAEEMLPQPQDPRQAMWMQRLEEEHDNFRAALVWCHAAGEKEIELRLAGALSWFWYVRGYLSEGRRWLEESITISQALGDKRGLAASLFWLGSIAVNQGDELAALPVLEESLALFQESGDKGACARALSALGDVALARSRYEEGLAILREAGDKRIAAQLLNNLGDLARYESDYEQAAQRYHESLVVSKEFNATRDIARSFHNLGRVALHQGDDDRAAALFTESIALFREQGSRQSIAECVVGLAGVAQAQGQPERAARLLGAVQAEFETISAAMWPADRVEYDRHVAATRAQMDEQAFAAAWAEGRAMTMEQAMAYALEEGAHD